MAARVVTLAFNGVEAVRVDVEVQIVGGESAFILVGLGLLALRDALSGTPGQQVALAAVVTWWIGAGLTLPYYGAEDFGLNAIAREAAGQQVDVLDLVQTVRFSPVPATVFLLGLLGLAVAAILAAVAIWRSGSLPRYSGVVFALGFALFIPQFYAPPAVRIAHGVLVGIGCVWVAVALWTAKPSLTAIERIAQRREVHAN